MKNNLDEEVAKAEEALEIAKRNSRVFRNRRILETIKSVIGDDENIKMFEESLHNDDLRHRVTIFIEHNYIKIDLMRDNANSITKLNDIAHKFWTNTRVKESPYASSEMY